MICNVKVYTLSGKFLFSLDTDGPKTAAMEEAASIARDEYGITESIEFVVKVYQD